MRTRRILLFIIIVSIGQRLHKTGRGDRLLVVLYSELLRRHKFGQFPSKAGNPYDKV